MRVGRARGGGYWADSAASIRTNCRVCLSLLVGRGPECLKNFTRGKMVLLVAGVFEDLGERVEVRRKGG